MILLLKYKVLFTKTSESLDLSKFPTKQQGKQANFFAYHRNL